ncbi:MAG: hypothetical protein M3Q07_25400 [Pseudobdellovibrionaceae bacterium]|nr:hypothetical protein [Pseudobdellovibrionaceae bacterium]
MRNLLALPFLFFASLPLFGGDCIYYVDPNQTGRNFERNNTDFEETTVPAGWHDVISSVWIKDGTYSILGQHHRFKGTRVYLYGAGWAVKDSVWIDAKPRKANGGSWFNLSDIGFDDTTSSTHCIRGG